jgi:hypothetical protein
MEDLALSEDVLFEVGKYIFKYLDSIRWSYDYI